MRNTNTPYGNEEDIEKSPHYFIAYFQERLTSVTRTTSGTSYTKYRNGHAVEVYGFTNKEEADTFDESRLHNLMVGVRDHKIIWAAPDEATLHLEISNDPQVKAGSWWLSENTVWEQIENLPECERMHTNTKTGQVLCGKPKGEYGDGCCGGCILQGNDQEFDPE